jgi:hypothetical protein
VPRGWRAAAARISVSAATPLSEPFTQPRLGQPRGAGARYEGRGDLAHTSGEHNPGAGGRGGAFFRVLPMYLM